MTSRIAPEPEGSTSTRTHAGHGGIARLLVGGLAAVLIAMVLVGVVGLRASSSPAGAGGLDRVLILGLLVLSLATGIAIAAVLARRVRNLAAVTEAARALAAGDLSARTAVRVHDEIGLIAEAFNDMADTIEALVRDERAEHVALEAAVEEFSGFASRVSRGDLTARLTPNRNPALARLAVDLNAMAGALATMSGQVRGASHEMGGATTQILAAVTEHTAATSEQAASIAQTSVTVEEVRATSEQAARRAQDVAAEAVKVAEVADEGLSAVDGIVQAMTAIQTRVERIAADILTLSEQSHAIGAITQTVNDLADQSNMLALNATIEAAKAGEQGRGFAVVAQEVRSLAEQSKAATAQVHGILGQIQAATRAAVVATEEGTTAVVDGTQRARRAGDAIERLTATMRDTAASATAIAASAREQHSGMDQIAHAINDVAATTHQIARGASDTQLAAVSLREVADRLDELTRRYTLASDIGRARPARTPHPAAAPAPTPTPVPVA